MYNNPFRFFTKSKSKRSDFKVEPHKNAEVNKMSKVVNLFRLEQSRQGTIGMLSCEDFY